MCRPSCKPRRTSAALVLWALLTGCTPGNLQSSGGPSPSPSPGNAAADASPTPSPPPAGACPTATFTVRSVPGVADSAAEAVVVDNWAYQLQGADEGAAALDPDSLAATPCDLFVIDYSAFGDEAGEFTAEQVARLQTAGRRRVVLAYMSIGEAEDYRFYWEYDGRDWSDNGPPWLVASNPAWPGNYKVEYWDPVWQSLILGDDSPAGVDRSYLARILAAGFDGVYLDIIDAYEFFAEAGPPYDTLRSAPQYAAAMADLVAAIARYARTDSPDANPDFLIVPQNGSGIIDLLTADQAADYLATIDAIGVEDTFFFGPADEDNPYAPQAEFLNFLATYADSGVAVLAIDYLADPESVARFAEECTARGFIPYASPRRALDRLAATPTCVDEAP